MGIISGKDGHIATGSAGGPASAAVGCVSNWQISHSADLIPVICSATDGAVLRVDGNEDWTGSWVTYGMPPSVKPGDAVFFAGAIEEGGASADGIGAEGDVIVESVAMEWDFEGGAPIKTTVSFGADGDLTLGKTLTIPADATTPDPKPSRACQIEIATPAASPSYSALDEVRSISLTITSAVQAIHTTSGAGWPTRIGGGWDATLEIGILADDTEGWVGLTPAFPTPNDSYAVKIYVDGTYYWDIKYFKFNEMGGMEVDIEGSGIVGCTLSAEFSGWAYYDAAWNKGYIKDCAASPVTWWP